MYDEEVVEAGAVAIGIDCGQNYPRQQSHRLLRWKNGSILHKQLPHCLGGFLVAFTIFSNRVAVQTVLLQIGTSTREARKTVWQSPFLLEPTGQPPEAFDRYADLLALIHWTVDGGAVTGHIHDFRQRIRRLWKQRNCCTFKVGGRRSAVGDGVSSFGDYDRISDVIAALPLWQWIHSVGCSSTQSHSCARQSGKSQIHRWSMDTWSTSNVDSKCIIDRSKFPIGARCAALFGLQVAIRMQRIFNDRTKPCRSS
eukprot:scaffold3931_cov172-Amphora_coffeaeformis.AAC.5